MPIAFGHVVQGEADDQEDAERGLAEREGGADRQSFAEVVQPDAERNLIGQRQRPRSVAVLRRRSESTDDDSSPHRQERQHRHQHRRVERAGGRQRRLLRLSTCRRPGRRAAQPSGPG